MKKKRTALVIWLCAIAVLLILALLAAPPEGQLAARGGLFRRSGPGLLAGMLVTVILLAAAALARVFAIPRFTIVPGQFQLFLEQLSCMADGLARGIKAVGRGVAGLGRGICTGVVKGIRGLITGVPALVRRVSEIRLSKRTKRALAVWIVLAAAPLVLSFVTGHAGGHTDIQAAMRDAVLHDVNKVSLFGLLDVNPGLVAAIVVSCTLLVAAALIRIFVVPQFTEVPGKFQMLLELAVKTLDGLAGSAESGKPTFIGAYVFAAGVYIFVGTLFELLGLQAVATNGASVTLPAPLSDVNAAICMGCQSYLVILGGGIAHAGLHGAGATLKEFSLPISMSFRLFGALLSGLLVTDLVYHYITLSYVLPVIVGVMFTLLHALIQTYVLTMLVGMYYAEVSEKPEPKRKKHGKIAVA